MFNGLTGWHALILLVVVVLFFGAAKLPGLAKSVGQSMKIFKNEVRSDDAPVSSAAPSTTATPTAAAEPVAGPRLNETSPEVRAQTDRTTTP